MVMGQWPAIVSDAPHLPATDGAPAFDAAELADVVGGHIVAMGTLPIRGGAVDSRKVTPGICFFALPGERTDGQRFLPEAVAAGAAALIVRHAPTPLELERLTARRPVTVIQVHDGQAALHAAARAWRARWDPLVVGVTGSLAKTSTKEQAAEVLAERWPVLRNEGNENNEIGLPLTLLRLSPEHRAAVLEMGMYLPGDIAQLADLARPGR
jgi:UDP-N-acetylmuramoyl-tripeptide--D-alanyl-D-alanine ligase